MTQNKLFNMGRHGVSGAALVLTVLILGSCSVTKDATEAIQTNVKPSLVHIEFHKKMLVDQIKQYTKINKR